MSDIKSDNIVNFSDWWAANKDKCIADGVSELAAHFIWSAACDSLNDAIIRKLNERFSKINLQ